MDRKREISTKHFTQKENNMNTTFVTRNGIQTTVSTFQGHGKTQVIVDNDSTNEFTTPMSQLAYHTEIREKVIKDGGYLLSGTIIETESAYSINEFTNKRM